MYKRQVSRFMVIDMPEMDEDSVLFVLRQHFPDGEKSALKAFAGLFLDLQIKAYHGEISTKSLDLKMCIRDSGYADQFCHTADLPRN